MLAGHVEIRQVIQFFDGLKAEYPKSDSMKRQQGLSAVASSYPEDVRGSVLLYPQASTLFSDWTAIQAEARRVPAKQASKRQLFFLSMPHAWQLLAAVRCSVTLSNHALLLFYVHSLAMFALSIRGARISTVAQARQAPAAQPPRLTCLGHEIFDKVHVALFRIEELLLQYVRCLKEDISWHGALRACCLSSHGSCWKAPQRGCGS